GRWDRLRGDPGRSGGAIHVCYKPGDVTKVGGAALEIIDSEAGGSCKAGDTQLSFNQIGPTGPSGASGPVGPSGATGPSGSSGSVDVQVFAAAGSETWTKPAGVSVVEVLVVGGGGGGGGGGGAR